MISDERTLLKMTIMVKEVEKRIFYKIDSHAQKKYDDNHDFSYISPLRMIFPDYVDNNLLKAIISQVYTIIPQHQADIWISACDKSNVFHSHQRRIELAKIYVGIHNFKRSSMRSFIFWALVAAVANKENFEENVALIIDFARIFEMKEDEISDISQLVKAFFCEEEKDYKFKNEEVAALFSGAWLYLKQD